MVNNLLTMMPFFEAFMGVAIIGFLIIYVYAALALMYIAKRTKTENDWLAWIPIANVYLMTKIAGVHPAWTLVIFLTIIPIVGGLLMAAAMIYFWWKIAEVRGKPGWWSLLMIIPLVNFVIMGILAWGE